MTLLDHLEVPIIAAPMAGGASTPELVAEVAAAGGFGQLAGGYLSVGVLADRINRLRALSERPFGVNLFVPGADTAEPGAVEAYRELLVAEGFTPGDAHHDDDAYQAKLELLTREPVPLVTFTFGCPAPEVVAALQGAGSEVGVTVTGPAEASLAAQAGADLVIVQGAEAGGHRALFVDDPADPAGGEALGLLVALRLVAAAVRLPMVAAGGIVDGAGVAAVLAAGAVAAQLGTAFLSTDEAGTAPEHRHELLAAGPGTAFTRAFSGRVARGIRNSFLEAHSAVAPAAYPQVHHLTKPIRASGGPESMSLWAGQGYPLGRALPAAELVEVLAAEARAATARLAERWGAVR
jgi:nitronate monooxygenase